MTAILGFTDVLAGARRLRAADHAHAAGMRGLPAWSVSLWDLAAYEVDELGEGFDDVARFHRHREGVSMPLDRAVQDYVTTPLGEVRAAIDARDGRRFAAAFDALTIGCNGCHVAANFAAGVIMRPPTNSYTNQGFAPRDH